MHELPDGQRYIGQTTQPLNRRFRNGKGYKSTDIADAIAEFGWHNVKTYILYSDIPVNELRRYETLCIDRWQTYTNGLNQNRGQDHVSDETCQKIANANRGKKRPELSKRMSGENHPMFGKRHTDETRQKISKANSGKTRTTDARRKMSESRRGQKGHFLGKRHTGEARQKISDTLRGKPKSAEHRAKISESQRRQYLEKRGQGTLF